MKSCGIRYAFVDWQKGTMLIGRCAFLHAGRFESLENDPSETPCVKERDTHQSKSYVPAGH
jgi:hypothetical protein